MWSQIINIVIGLLVTIIPEIAEVPEDMAVSNYITGPLIITFALIACSGVARNVRLFNIPCGIWLVVSSWVLSYTGDMIMLHMAVGILVVIFSLIKGKITQRFGGGWRSLFKNQPLHLMEAEKKYDHLSKTDP